MPKPVLYRGRFAPSPTGQLHFGSLIAAVGSYLQARVAHGEWLIRIEDLDKPRVLPGAADNIIRTLAAFGFQWQGSIEYQSQRIAHYAAAITRLRELHLVYPCSCSRAEIAALYSSSDALAETGEIATEELRYPGTCRQQIGLHSPTALRFLAPQGIVKFVDRAQGPQAQDVAKNIGDFVVQRRDGIYAYHLAVVVDDAAQGITEIVRGADLLASTLRQILLQQALGLPTPAYVHLPLAIDRAGHKLSKASQSQAIDPAQASSVLWQALDALKQTPPRELIAAPLPEVWEWAFANWSLASLANQSACQAPAP